MKLSHRLVQYRLVRYLPRGDIFTMRRNLIFSVIAALSAFFFTVLVGMTIFAAILPPKSIGFVKSLVTSDFFYMNSSRVEGKFYSLDETVVFRQATGSITRAFPENGITRIYGNMDFSKATTFNRSYTAYAERITPVSDGVSFEGAVGRVTRELRSDGFEVFTPKHSFGVKYDGTLGEPVSDIEDYTACEHSVITARKDGRQLEVVVFGDGNCYGPTLGARVNSLFTGLSTQMPGYSQVDAETHREWYVKYLKDGDREKWNGIIEGTGGSNYVWLTEKVQSRHEGGLNFLGGRV